MSASPPVPYRNEIPYGTVIELVTEELIPIEQHLQLYQRLIEDEQLKTSVLVRAKAILAEVQGKARPPRTPRKGQLIRDERTGQIMRYVRAENETFKLRDWVFCENGSQRIEGRIREIIELAGGAGLRLDEREAVWWADSFRLLPTEG